MGRSSCPANRKTPAHQQETDTPTRRLRTNKALARCAKTAV
ncbi:hypothetical protein COLSTE_00813 [Collinsella stercoris DSM 13279]|uniref:Uncharacterized protein n=1 Tax=Collinsella stercoris DSM 13279 TaxID=445975 RepID=B6G9S2_9ACTN|nr:hypothetical protein COLSTE_00813 [Collinsella stercoris DSM 13279]